MEEKESGSVRVANKRRKNKYRTNKQKKISMSVLNSETNVYKQWNIHQNKHNHINIFMRFVIHQFPYSHPANCYIYTVSHLFYLSYFVAGIFAVSQIQYA